MKKAKITILLLLIFIPLIIFSKEDGGTDVDGGTDHYYSSFLKMRELAYKTVSMTTTIYSSIENKQTNEAIKIYHHKRIHLLHALNIIKGQPIWACRSQRIYSKVINGKEEIMACNGVATKYFSPTKEDERPAATIGSKGVYLNIPFMLEKKLDQQDLFVIAVHEAGHWAGIKNHELLDIMGHLLYKKIPKNINSNVTPKSFKQIVKNQFDVELYYFDKDLVNLKYSSCFEFQGKLAQLIYNKMLYVMPITYQSHWTSWIIKRGGIKIPSSLQRFIGPFYEYMQCGKNLKKKQYYCRFRIDRKGNFQSYIGSYDGINKEIKQNITVKIKRNRDKLWAQLIITDEMAKILFDLLDLKIYGVSSKDQSGGIIHKGTPLQALKCQANIRDGNIQRINRTGKIPLYADKTYQCTISLRIDKF